METYPRHERVGIQSKVTLRKILHLVHQGKSFAKPGQLATAQPICLRCPYPGRSGPPDEGCWNPIGLLSTLTLELTPVGRIRSLELARPFYLAALPDSGDDERPKGILNGSISTLSIPKRLATKPDDTSAPGWNARFNTFQRYNNDSPGLFTTSIIFQCAISTTRGIHLYPSFSLISANSIKNLFKDRMSSTDFFGSSRIVPNIVVFPANDSVANDHSMVPSADFKLVTFSSGGIWSSLFPARTFGLFMTMSCKSFNTGQWLTLFIFWIIRGLGTVCFGDVIDSLIFVAAVVLEAIIAFVVVTHGGGTYPGATVVGTTEYPSGKSPNRNRVAVSDKQIDLLFIHCCWV